MRTPRDVATRVDAESQSRGVDPALRLDVQSFIWAALQMEEGKYGGIKKKKKAKPEAPEAEVIGVAENRNRVTSAKSGSRFLGARATSASLRYFSIVLSERP